MAAGGELALPWLPGAAIALAGGLTGAGATLAASRGVTAVQPGTAAGVYCLKLAATPSVGVASVRGDSATSGSARVLIPAGTAACGTTGDTSAEVLTTNSGGTAVSLPFSVLFG